MTTGTERHLELFRLKALIDLEYAVQREGVILVPDQLTELQCREQKYVELRARELCYETHGEEYQESESDDLEHDRQVEEELIYGPEWEQEAEHGAINRF